MLHRNYEDINIQSTTSPQLKQTYNHTPKYAADHQQKHARCHAVTWLRIGLCTHIFTTKPILILLSWGSFTCDVNSICTSDTSSRRAEWSLAVLVLLDCGMCLMWRDGKHGPNTHTHTHTHTQKVTSSYDTILKHL